MNVTGNIILKVLEDGIWYYNTYGKVCHLSYTVVSTHCIRGKNWGRNMQFKWENLKKKFWLTKEEAEKEASKYLEKLKKINISVSLLKRINEFINSKKSDCHFYIIDEYGLGETSPDFYFFDKNKLALICEYEYDDDYGGGLDEEEYPLVKYGKTWALTEEELK